MAQSPKSNEYATKEDLARLADDLHHSIAALHQTLAVPIGEVVHQVESLTFTSLEDVTVYDLTVNFGEKDVKTKDPGPFRKAVSEARGGGTRITLSKGEVPKAGKADVMFERDGAFRRGFQTFTTAISDADAKPNASTSPATSQPRD